MLAALLASAAGASAAPPAWWSVPFGTNNTVPINNNTGDDFAVANIGQLKTMAAAARAMLNTNYAGSGGAGAAIDSLVTGWLGGGGDNYAAVNQGQLKTVAKLFYDRLATLGWHGAPLTGSDAYPWSTATTDDESFALVNIGQLKTVFSFDPTPVGSAIRHPDPCESGFATLPANDDGSTGTVAMGLSVNLGGTAYADCYVNNNGNITFNSSQGVYTPGSILTLGFPIIAAYWADVDTRGAASNTVRYGQCTVGGRNAFYVNYLNVGYYNTQDDKLNVFQIVVIDRSDIAAGDADVEFNYEQVLWETGSASDGINGYGGTPARVGINNGANLGLEFPHSGETLQLLDSDPTTGAPNTATGLIYQTRNSSVPGRIVYQIRSGVVQ